MPGHPLALPALMLVTDRLVAGGEDALVEKVAEAVAGGVTVVQVREKDLAPEQLAALADRVKAAIGGRAALVINSDADVARKVGADGVHFPENAAFPGDRAGLITGRSVHSVESALQAAAEGVDYVVVGPAYVTESHPGVAPGGPQLISDVAAAVSVSVIAIGGIDAGRTPEMVSAGAAGIAVVRAILASESPRDAASSIRRALRGREGVNARLQR